MKNLMIKTWTWYTLNYPRVTIFTLLAIFATVLLSLLFYPFAYLTVVSIYALALVGLANTVILYIEIAKYVDIVMKQFHEMGQNIKKQLE